MITINSRLNYFTKNKGFLLIYLKCIILVLISLYIINKVYNIILIFLNNYKISK
jgi:hypothetical protein